MVHLFFKNVSVLMIFSMIAAYSWIHGGVRADLMRPVMPWFWILVAEALLFFPQRHHYESAEEARTRVWKGVKKDPVFYAFIVLMIVLLMPLVNHGLCPACDYPQILAGMSPDPLIPFAPFCVNIKQHWGVVLWFAPIMTAVLACRHSLLREGKRSLVEFMVWNAALLVIFGFIQQVTGAQLPWWNVSDKPTVWFFSVFGYANMGGAFFVMNFALSVGLWRYRVDEVDAIPVAKKSRTSVVDVLRYRWLRANYPLIPLVLIFLGALETLSRAAIMFSFVLAALAFLYSFCGLFAKGRDAVKRVKRMAVYAAGLLVFIFAVAIFAPDNLFKEMESTDANTVASRISGKTDYHTQAAWAVFKDHPLFGCGGWGYMHFSMPYLPDSVLNSSYISPGTANVHNDYLQFMVEHGIVGLGSLFAVFVSLVIPIFVYWGRISKRVRFLPPAQRPAHPEVLYALPPAALWILVSSIVLIIHAFADCPMRSPAVLATFYLSLACADGFLPHISEK